MVNSIRENRQPQLGGAAAIAGRSLVIDGGFQNGLLQPVERMLSKTGVESREWRRERSGGLNLLDGGKEIVPALS